MQWRDAFRTAARELAAADIEASAHEASYLLEWATGKSLSQWILEDGVLSQEAEERLWEGVRRRQRREPLAYIVGRREFYGLNLRVGPAVLIPRPETEGVVERVLTELQAERATVADIGTGSGAIALALKHERPRWTVIGADVDPAALKIARDNGMTLGLEVLWLESDLMEAVPRPLDAIAANLPYVREGDPCLAEETAFEPPHALFAPQNGEGLIRRLIVQSREWLRPGGLLVLECGYQQAATLSEWMRLEGFQGIAATKDFSGIERVLSGRWPGEGGAHGRIH
ncbi:MAG: peptide chain release factor N(5)-glutamine methyltransferase [Firmicutes bacterium]|nr:peptide chain release factor N(5)-glutamine methyltransferase [Bacillota bacterium]